MIYNLKILSTGMTGGPPIFKNLHIYIYRDITIGETNIYNIYIIRGFSSNIAILFLN